MIVGTVPGKIIVSVFGLICAAEDLLKRKVDVKGLRPCGRFKFAA